MNNIYTAIIISLINIYNFAAFEPLSSLGKDILRSSEIAAHDLASKTIDAAKVTKNRTEEFLHNPAPAPLDQPKTEPIINKYHPHLRSVTKTYTQVR